MDLHEANKKLQAGAAKAGADTMQERKQMDEQRRQVDEQRRQVEERAKTIDQKARTTDEKERTLQNLDQELKKRKARMDQLEQQLQKVHCSLKRSFSSCITVLIVYINIANIIIIYKITLSLLIEKLNSNGN